MLYSALSYPTVFSYWFKTSAASILKGASFITYVLYYLFLAYFSYDLDDRLIESQLDSSCTYSGWLHQVLHFPCRSQQQNSIACFDISIPSIPPLVFFFSLLMLYLLYLISRFLDILLTLHTEDLNLDMYVKENVWYFSLGTFIQHDCFWFHPCIYKFDYLILLCDWVIFFCLYVPHLLTFFSWSASRFILFLSYWE